MARAHSVMTTYKPRPENMTDDERLELRARKMVAKQVMLTCQVPLALTELIRRRDQIEMNIAEEVKRAISKIV